MMPEEENNVDIKNGFNAGGAGQENAGEADENVKISTEEAEDGGKGRTGAERSVKKTVKRVLTIAGFTLLGLLVVIVGWLCIQKYIMKSPAPSLFGYSSFIISTGSMSGMIEEGDIVIVKKTGNYEQGDVITFIHDGEQTPTTHMIFAVLKDDDGNVTGYITRGVANNTYDTEPVTEDEILGEVVKIIPHLGLFFIWLKSEGGWIYLVGVVLIVVIGVFLYQKFIKERNDGGETAEEAEDGGEPSEPSAENGAENGEADGKKE